MGPDGINPLIDVLLLRDVLDELTGDAVKLAVYLASTDRRLHERADAAWAKALASKIGLPAKILQKTVKELSDSGLVTLTGRINLGPTSDPPPSVARRRGRVNTDGPHDLDGPQDDKPPWERKRGEPRSGEAKGEAGDAQVESGARGLNGEVRPGSLSDPDGKPVSPHTFVVAWITHMYRDCYSRPGAECSPRWDGRTGKIVKALLSTHSPEEIVRRARIMFYETRAFPKPPYDVFTLHTHFDKFVLERSLGGMVGDPRRTGAAYYGEVTNDV